MKIALLGYGKMGRLIESSAHSQGHTILTKDKVNEADIWIDFSHPDVALKNVRLAVEHKKNLVMGTTGWFENLPEVKNLIDNSDIGFLYSPNFSIGIHIFMNIVQNASSLINDYHIYDISGFEQHHNQKVDHPSGTGRAIAEKILINVDRKKQVTYQNPDGAIDKETLHFTSLRCGYEPGKHSVIFDSPADTITLTHQARNREGFASGALLAAEWLLGKKGFYTLDDMINQGS